MTIRKNPYSYAHVFMFCEQLRRIRGGETHGRLHSQSFYLRLYHRFVIFFRFISCYVSCNVMYKKAREGPERSK